MNGRRLFADAVALVIVFVLNIGARGMFAAGSEGDGSALCGDTCG